MTNFIAWSLSYKAVLYRAIWAIAILCMYFLLINPINAILKDQELRTVTINQNSLNNTGSQVNQLGRTYNRHINVRHLDSKTKNYPILDQLESLLYPKKNFKREHPASRLKRLEIAVLGLEQKNTLDVATRLQRIKNEVIAWQIANEQVLNMLNFNNKEAYSLKKSQAFYSERLAYLEELDRMYGQDSLAKNKRDYNRHLFNAQKPVYVNTSYTNTRALAKTRQNQDNPDYFERQSYGVVVPILKNIGRQGVGAIFK